MRALSGTGPSDVWAVGTAGVLLHYDGTRWSEVAGPSASLYGVAAVGKDVWIAGSNGALLRHRRP